MPRLLDAARSAPGFEQLALEPLAHEASLSLLADVGDPAGRERVAREAAGNPLFLGELARASRAAGDALPRTVIAAVTLELAMLDPAARALLDGAAVAGDPFDPELAAAAAGRRGRPGRARRARGGHLVRADGAGAAFAFRHPLIRRAVYDAAPPAWRLLAHERAAAELGGAARAPRCAPTTSCGSRGRRRAGDRGAPRGGRGAAGRAPTVAVQFYEAALALVPDGRRGELLVSLALALAAAGRLEDSRAALVEALERTPSLELAIATARVETQLSRHAEARQRLLAARAAAPPRPPRCARLRAGRPTPSIRVAWASCGNGPTRPCGRPSERATRCWRPARRARGARCAVDRRSRRAPPSASTAPPRA